MERKLVNKNEKKLIVVDSINIEDRSGSKANVALIHNLVAAGFEIMVYHYTLKNIQLKGVNCVAIPEIKFSPLYILSRIQRVLSRKLSINFAPFLKKMGFSFTFFNDTNSIAKALKKCTFEPDLVLALSKGGSFRSHYAVLQLSELRSKWMAYVHEPYPFHFYPRPYTCVESNYKQKEIFFTKVSEKVKYSTFPSQLLLEWMGSFYPNFLKTGVVIPHQSLKYKIQNFIYEKHPSLYILYFQDFVGHLLARMEREEKEKIKNTLRLEFQIGKAILRPVRFIKLLFR